MATRARHRLTVKGIERIRPGAKSRLVADGGGLYLAVSPTNARSWIYRYQDRAHKRHEIGLGSLQVVGLAEAREMADQIRRGRAEGIDPLQQRAVARQKQADVPSFATVANEYIETHRAGWKSAVHLATWRRTMGALVFRDKPVDQVTTQDIVRTVKANWPGKFRTQRETIDRIRIVLAAAASAGHRDPDAPNPARWKDHLENLMGSRPKTGPKHHRAMPYREVPAFMAQLRDQNGVAARALEFLILTAARTGEVIEATWSEIDLAAGWWVIPGARMKTGEEHRIPLSARAIEILQALPRKGERMFPEVHEKTLYRIVTKTFGLPYTAHGFRSSFGDWCTENDVPAHLREVALAHQEGNAVVRAYVRSEMLEMRRSLAERWCAFCSGGEVIPLRLVR